MWTFQGNRQHTRIHTHTPPPASSQTNVRRTRSSRFPSVSRAHVGQLPQTHTAPDGRRKTLFFLLPSLSTWILASVLLPCFLSSHFFSSILLSCSHFLNLTLKLDSGSVRLKRKQPSHTPRWWTSNSCSSFTNLNPPPPPLLSLLLYDPSLPLVSCRHSVGQGSGVSWDGQG